MPRRAIEPNKIIDEKVVMDGKVVNNPEMEKMNTDKAIAMVGGMSDRVLVGQWKSRKASEQPKAYRDALKAELKKRGFDKKKPANLKSKVDDHSASAPLVENWGKDEAEEVEETEETPPQE